MGRVPLPPPWTPDQLGLTEPPPIHPEVARIKPGGKAIIAATIILYLLVLHFCVGCASVTYPNPHNSYYHQAKDGTWYCYGANAGQAIAGKWYDDPCRIDVCEMHMPEPECLPMGLIKEPSDGAVAGQEAVPSPSPRP